MNCEGCGSELRPFEICERCLIHGDPRAPKPVGILNEQAEFTEAVERLRDAILDAIKPGLIWLVKRPLIASIPGLVVIAVILLLMWGELR